MPAGLLKVGTCQFDVSASIKRNAWQICELLNRASRDGAEIVHFPECALSGYAGKDFETFDGFDWALLRGETEKIMALGAKLRLWVALGSAHQLSEPNKPHNSLYLIDPEGKIADRYDKRFCMSEDLPHYTPGNRFVTFDVNGVKCALLICFDVRFPELYRQLYKQKVNCVLQSFYNARQKGPSVHAHIMRQTMQCRAATNHFWVSMTNSSGHYSPYPSCFIQPDGKIVRQLRHNQAGVMVNTVDLSKEFYDPMAPFRDMAVDGALTNGPETIMDERSRETTIL
ncbi:MAG: carbon-nitrogen hydrolase family protein [Planctomycetota bacterium]|jgi:predicted amidohydrolase